MTHYCEHCDREFTNPRCPRCGGPPARREPDVGPPPDPMVKRSRIVSDPDDRLDDMIEQASRPTLASLLRKGIKSGLIKPAHEYNSGPKP